MNRTKISYCDFSWNPVRGCARVSPGCQSCYAERIAARFSGSSDEDLWRGRGIPYVSHAPFVGVARMTADGPRWTGEVSLVESKLDEPLRARRSAEKFLAQHGRKPIVFVEDMGDLYYEAVPVEWQDRVFAVMALADWFDYLVLTKRAEQMAEHALSPGRRSEIYESAATEAFDEWSVAGRSGQLPAHAQISDGQDGSAVKITTAWPLPHVMLGVSAEDQPRFDERVGHLYRLSQAGWRTWMSLEPLLGPIDMRMGGMSLAEYAPHRPFALERIAIGGESGPGARPCAVEWVESLVSQARAAGVKCHVKQDSGPKSGIQGRIPNHIWKETWHGERS